MYIITSEKGLIKGKPIVIGKTYQFKFDEKEEFFNDDVEVIYPYLDIVVDIDSPSNCRVFKVEVKNTYSDAIERTFAKRIKIVKEISNGGLTISPYLTPEEFFEDEEMEMHYVYATLSTDEEVLKYLYGLKNENINIYLAKNPYTPVNILEELVNSKEIDVKMFLADNNSTPSHILGKLTKDEFYLTQEGAFRNKNVTIEMLKNNINSECSQLLTALATSHLLTEDMANLLFNKHKEDVYILTSLYKNSNVSKELKQKILELQKDKENWKEYYG